MEHKYKITIIATFDDYQDPGRVLDAVQDNIDRMIGDMLGDEPTESEVSVEDA